MPDRFFYPDPLPMGEVLLTGTEAHHLLHVMRAEIGTSVELFDGRGNVALGTVTRLHRKEVEIALGDVRHEAEQEGLTLFTAVPKGDRFRWLVEKATELGVARIVPLSTERSVVSPRETKLKKMEQTVISACKQSGRNWLMPISEVTDLKQALETIPDTTQLLAAHPEGSTLSELDFSSRGNVAVMIGPEGGFSEQEADWLMQSNVQLVCLGSNILRTETAAVALASWSLWNHLPS